MITIIALLSFVPACFILLVGVFWADWDDIALPVLVTIISIALGCLGMLAIGTFLFEKELVFVEEYDLVAFNDGYSASGQFFLGIGAIENSPIIKFLAKENGMIKMYSVQGEFYINETANYEATAIKYITNLKNWFFNLFYISECNTYIFNVPEGTIKYNYSIDLQ